ncbi:MAG: hypothetical protein LBL45_11325 [Treponema sp.]|jgi:hypothetical protein|nr:hypothetical protein [Treponema sp.]
MEMVRRGLKTRAAAPVEMGASCRRAERICQRYRAGGDGALVHGGKGSPSNHKTDQGIIERALELYRRKHPDFDPALAAEKTRGGAGWKLERGR